MFRPDATLLVSDGREARTIEGPTAIGELIDRAVASLDVIFFTNLNTRIDLYADGDGTARARTYIRELHFAERHLVVAKEIYGVYLDRYVRTEDRWWFVPHVNGNVAGAHRTGSRGVRELSGRARRLARLMRLHDHLDYLSSAEPEAEFVATTSRSITRAEAAQEVDRLAAAFRASGLQPGDRVALLSRNSLEYPMLYFAASKAGLVSVPLNVRLVPGDWAYIVQRCLGQARRCGAGVRRRRRLGARRPARCRAVRDDRPQPRWMGGPAFLRVRGDRSVSGSR